MAPILDKASGIDVFPRLILGSGMNSTEHDLLIKSLKIKPPIFHGTDTEDVFESISDYYERLHKMSIMQQHVIEFVTFLLEKNAKQLWRPYVECRSLVLLQWI